MGRACAKAVRGVRGIAKGESVIELIPSKDVREHVRKAGWEFSDRDKAALAHHLGLPCEEEFAVLEELKGELQDEEVIAQVDAYLAHERRQLAAARRLGAGFVFVLEYQEEGDQFEYPQGYFADLETACRFGKLAGVEFTVEKHRMLGKGTPKPESNDALLVNPAFLPEASIDELVIRSDDPDLILYDARVAWMRFTAEGELLRFWCGEGEGIPESREELEPIFGRDTFENAYVQMPNLFEAGDIVRCVGPSCFDGRIGVVETSQEQWAEYEERQRTTFSAVCDFSDAQIIVEFWSEEGGFSHSHVQPVYIERYEVPEDAPERDVLMCASDLLAGRGGLDWFLMHLDKYRDHA